MRRRARRLFTRLNSGKLHTRKSSTIRTTKHRKIVGAYDILLDRMARQGAGEAEDNWELQMTDIADDEDGRLDFESPGGGGDTTVKRRVGCEEEMRAIAVAKLGEMQRKEWVMQWNGHVFKIREQVTRIVRIMQHVSSLASQAASTNPQAGLALAGVCVLLPLIVNDTDERQAAIDGVEHVTRIVARFRTVEDDYVSGRYGKNEHFERALVALYRRVAFFYMKAACYFARSTPFRSIRGLVAADEWKPTLDSVKVTETECHSFVATLGWSKSLEKVDKVLEDLSRVEFKDLIKDIENWLIPNINVEGQHHAKQPKLASGYDKAGSWLLDMPEFKSWEGEEDAGQFWISGAVGTGKSSLVAIIVDRIRRMQQENVAFFYCIVDTPGTTEHDVVVTRILRGLLGQLAMSQDRKRIAEEIEVAFDQSAKPGALGRVPLSLDAAKVLLVKIINTRRSTTIIIDGLDEVPDSRHLLLVLKDIDKKVDAKRLRLLLASQSVVPISDYFPLAKVVVAGGQSSMTDMKSFIGRRVQQFNKDRPNILSSGLSEDIVETLSTKAEGMFKWAELSLKQVLDHDNTSTEIAEHWKSVKEQEFRGLLVDLVRTYDVIYKKSLPFGDQRHMVQRAAQRALLWVLGAERGLRRKEYLALQKGETNEASAAKTDKICQNFIHLSEDGEIAASHSSVWDYISLKVTDQVDKFVNFAESENNPDAIREIILDCLKIIIDSDGSSSGDEPEDQLSEKSPNPLLHYACHHWPNHLGPCIRSGRDSSNLLKQAVALFDPTNVNALRRWIEVYDPDWDSQNMSKLKPPDPLYYAVWTEGDDIVRFVLDNSESSSWTGGPLGKALQLACYLGKTSTVREILRKVSVNEADDQREVVDLLINEYEANVNASSAAFGNAVQIALALRDQGLLESLVNHGAQYNPTDCRGMIWANVWRQIRESGWSEPNKLLRKWVKDITTIPQLPTALDSRLQILHTCIVYQHRAAKQIGREEPASPPNPEAATLMDRLSVVTKHICTADLSTSGYIPIVLTWVLLFRLMEFSQLNNSIEVYEIVHRHEIFIQEFGESLQDNPTLHAVLTQLFALAVRVLTTTAIRIIGLKGLSIEAEALEESAKETAAKRLLSLHNERTLSAMNKMANDISEMKQQISQLVGAVQMLVALQRKSDDTDAQAYWQHDSS
ncbi:hypothetical protein QBC33DRAFT_614675 [Phialemonium atrogriseum]|uniref:NACHT domain-containing protein n=1 Tax=Phialemonium atrogriseum TaxID=1093897 RepID=A0AAJ0BPN2_9PEZI|nr:uncharacterized protein QBC33DRAFT_614675 [Phialemonium atrogriseum]KAK1761777.1 hypothetical protein QBC33DRAFT_614675 [Phialemonium atrogriseum]